MTPLLVFGNMVQNSKTMGSRGLSFLKVHGDRGIGVVSNLEPPRTSSNRTYRTLQVRLAADINAPTLAGAESKKLKSGEWVSVIKAGEFFQASELKQKAEVPGARVGGLLLPRVKREEGSKLDLFSRDGVLKEGLREA